MLKSCGAFFVSTRQYMSNRIPFTKQFASSASLVDLLESRGLEIDNRRKAIGYIDNIGYYRLSAYMYPLLTIPLKLADMRHCCSWVDFTRKHGTDALFRITLGDFWT